MQQISIFVQTTFHIELAVSFLYIAVSYVRGCSLFQGTPSLLYGSITFYETGSVTKYCLNENTAVVMLRAALNSPWLVVPWTGLLIMLTVIKCE
jgi:hypothetical protein